MVDDMGEMPLFYSATDKGGNTLAARLGGAARTQTQVNSAYLDLTSTHKFMEGQQFKIS